MLLERYLRERRLTELKEVYSFWDSDSQAPENMDTMVKALHDHLTDEDLVRKRLRFLSKKLVDLLRFLLKSDRYQATLNHILNSKAFAYMSQYEVEAAINALQKRGFVFVSGVRDTAGDATIYAVPRELGEILENFLWEADRELKDCMSMEACLRRKFNGSAEQTVRPLLRAEANQTPVADLEEANQILVSPEELGARRERLSEEYRNVFDIAVWRYGGILSKAQYDRVRPRLPKWDRRQLKEAFEDNCLGAVRHFALGEYGINHFDDTLIIFEEVVSRCLLHLPAPDSNDPDEICNLGVDFISDISSFLSYVGSSKMRLTLNGHVYRTAVKKVAEHFILNKKDEYDDQATFDLVFAFSQTQKLIQKKDERTLSLTIKGRSWENMSLDKKLKMLLNFVSDEFEAGAERFHTPSLRKLTLQILKEQPLSQWIDVNGLSWMARNRYVTALDELGVRDAFQNRYQYSAEAGMRDIHQLAHMMSAWVRNRLYLLGLVDLAFASGKPVKLRLTLLGARALGKETEEQDDVAQKPLIVNPDFEVIVFPDGDLYELVCRLDRFCVRIKSDSTYHYRVTAESVEKAVAQGLSASEILTVLSENARVDIPQNVIYSIREWAENVKFVSLQPSVLLRARNKEVVDRIVQTQDLKALVRERVAPTVLVMNEDLDQQELAKSLEAIGVFIDGNGHAVNGEAKRGDEQAD